MDKLSHLLKTDIESLTRFAIICVFTFLSTLVFRKFFNRFIIGATRNLHNDPTRYKFVGHAIVALIYTVGLSTAISQVESLRSLASSMMAGAGILAVAIGFASQNALSNIISGVFLVVFKPFRIGDRLRVQDKHYGEVEDITLRHTVLRDPENRRIVIPNSIMNSEVIVNSNYNDNPMRRFIEIGISYTADIDRVRVIMQEESLKHPNCLDRRTPEEIEANINPIIVRVSLLTDYAIVMRAEVWTRDNSGAREMEYDLLESIKKRFDQEGIEIPYPNMVIHQKKV